MLAFLLASSMLQVQDPIPTHPQGHYSTYSAAGGGFYADIPAYPHVIQYQSKTYLNGREIILEDPFYWPYPPETPIIAPYPYGELLPPDRPYDPWWDWIPTNW